MSIMNINRQLTQEDFKPVALKNKTLQEILKEKPSRRSLSQVDIFVYKSRVVQLSVSDRRYKL